MSSDIHVLVDFGSTFTKVVAVDAAAAELLGAVRVPSTVETDVTAGLREALSRLPVQVPDKSNMLACSSAAGGLRMVCVGFVPELTSEAGRRAALGAGAKVVGGYSYRLNRGEVTEIEQTAPDIVLLCGGTDGGDTATILHNAGMLAKSGASIATVIVAGNKSAADDVRALFDGTDKEVVFTANVMPEIGRLETAACHRAIRDLFMRRIVEAKGIGRARELVEDIIMPTPAAVMAAARLLATELGELLVVDVGGATTDVHSVARGTPARSDAVVSGLPEPYEKRTVEGDLGLKHNIETLCELVGDREVPDGFNDVVADFHEGKLPATEREYACQSLLASLTVATAAARHAGRLEVVYGPTGRTLVQRGKDLTRVGAVVGTGGPLVFGHDAAGVLAGARYDAAAPSVLTPKDPAFFLDAEYLLFAVGLLAQAAPAAARALAMKYLERL
jgi:uncharacterized protein (TIGR01319 family)